MNNVSAQHAETHSYGDMGVESLRTGKANVNGHETGNVTDETKKLMRIRLLK